MAEEVKFIEFQEVPNAPKIAVPADFSEDEIKKYLKSESVENAMFQQGFNFKYGLQPVDMLEMQNLDDGSVKAGLKGGWDSLKAIGQGALAGFYDFIGAEENQKEALRIADQYMLDRSAHIFRVNEEGKLLPRINTIEDIINDEEQLTAFTKYVKYQFGNAAATSVPAILAGVLGGLAGSIVPGVGTVAGSMGAVALSGWVFGLGDTYLAQAEELGPEGDPNVYLSMALGIPYGAVEMIGIGKVVPSLIKTFGSKQAAAEAVKKGIVQQVKQGTKGNLKKVPGMFAKGILETGLQEGLAEAVQETLNRTAAGVAGGINFENLYSDKEFLKQLGEAAAAGFFGGWGFGVINPAAQTIKMIGQGTGPIGVKGGGMVSDLNVDPAQPAFVDRGFAIGDIVSVQNRFNPDIDADVPLFGKKPKFKVLGTGIIDGIEQYILQAEDLPAAIEFVPTTSHNMIDLEQPTPTAGNEDTEENYTYAPLNEGESTFVNENLRKQYSESKKALVQTGYISDAQDKTVDTYLGGREKIINSVVNKIESERVQQKTQRDLLTDEQKTEMRNEGLDPEKDIEGVNPLFKKYDRFEGEELAAEVNKDYAYWRDLSLISEAELDAGGNNFADQEKDITRLGYNIGDRGKAYIESLRKNVTSTKQGKSTEGRDRLNDIIKNNTPFSSVPALYGGPETVRTVIGEKETITEPLTAQQKASLTGDKLIPIMQYHPALLTETITFEDLYVIPVNTRIRMILELAGALDSRGWKHRGLKNYPFINTLRSALRDKVNSARAEFGTLSDVYKQAVQDLKDFENQGEHLLRADVQMGDIVETFRLHNILSPTAIAAAERRIRNIQADSRYASKDPAVKNPLVSEILAYEALVASAYRSRKQINELLKSLSLEPILDTPITKKATTWNTLTFTKIKTALTKYQNRLNQTETKVKRTPIISEHVRLQVTEPGQDPEPSFNMDFELDMMSVMQTLRDQLNKLGLTNVDLAILNSIKRRLELTHAKRVSGEYRQATYEAAKALIELKAQGIHGNQLKPVLTLDMIKIAFSMDTFEKSTPAEKRIMLARALHTLHHESIHAFHQMDMFTKEEWRVLVKEADDKWIDEFGIKKAYPKGDLELWREEAIAEAFGVRAFGERYPQKSLIRRAFIRIKAFLLALASALEVHGFLTPESIFNHIEAGIVGQRNKTRTETASIYRDKDLHKMTLVNPHGTLVMSNNLLDTPENITYQRRVIELMTGERVIPLREYENLVQQGYVEGIPELVSTRIFTDGDGTRHQGGPEGPVVPPLSLFEGVAFEVLRLDKAKERHMKQIEMFEKEGKGTIAVGLDDKIITDAVIDKNLKDVIVKDVENFFDENPNGSYPIDGSRIYSIYPAPYTEGVSNDAMNMFNRGSWQRTLAQYITQIEYWKAAARDLEAMEVKLAGMIDEKRHSENIPAVGVDGIVNVKFSTKANEIRWSLNTEEKTMGAYMFNNPHWSMYTHMTPDQFLSLASSLQKGEGTAIFDITRKDSINYITKGIKKGKKVAVPWIEIEISSDGTTARVIGHQGRHRATVAKYLNGVQSTIPVAIKFNLKETTVPLNPKAREKFYEENVGNVQRYGAAEKTMLDVTMFHSGVLAPALEHIGDLTHRITEFPFVYGTVKEKVEKMITALDRSFEVWGMNMMSFLDEHEQNITNNLNYRKLNRKDYVTELQDKLDAYVVAHSLIPTYNEIQGHAKQAAIAIGNLNVDKALEHLRFIKRELDKGKTSFEKKAREVGPGDAVFSNEASTTGAYKATLYGRQDPTHRAILSKWLKQGTLSNEDFTTTQSSSQIIDKVYQSFEVTEANEFNFSEPYIDYNNPTVRYSVGNYTEPEINMNRQEKRSTLNKTIKAIDDSTEPWVGPGGTATPRNMSAPMKVLGHARSIAKLNTPFQFLYNTFMYIGEKTRSLQQHFTEILSRRYMQVIEDPAMKEMLAKAMIIAQMNDLMDMKVDAQGRLTFIAKEDGGAADLPVKQGEIIVLEGDVAGAFLDVHRVFQEVNNEYLRAEIAREHVPNLLKALNLMRRYFPALPELRTVFNFEGLTEEEISARLENLNYTQIKFITTSIENIMIMRTQMDGNVAETINVLLGTKDAGLNKLLNTAGNVTTMNRKMYVPLSRFGDIFIAVHQTVTVKDKKGKTKEVEKLVWYQQFETMGEANAARDGLRLKFPDATISQPAVQTIEKLRALVRDTEKPPSMEFLSQFMTDTNALKFQEVLQELRQVLEKKGLDKDVMGMKQFYTSRDKSVGAEGVPGYSADFPRSIMQFLMVASSTLARNRYAKDKNKWYTETIEHALEQGDTNLLKFTEKYYKYVEDPVQEFSNLRRMGFWWYLGGNISSAFLQTMSLVQFTGPLLSQMAGTKATVTELGKAFTHASGMVVHSMNKRQYQDAFLDFERLPAGEQNAALREALFRAIADGTIKQGQAYLEAGIVPSMGGPLVGSQRYWKKQGRRFENIVIGGTFNTFEAASRITAYIATYNLAVNDPKVLDQADLLYGDDMNYQAQMKQFGRTAEALARFMTSETFGVYGKENRQWLGRNVGSLAALFMTYMTQMMGLMYRMLNPPIIKRKASGKGFEIGVANPAKTRLQNKVGRRAFARIMLMMLITGGVFGLPGGEDAEDLYDLVKKMHTGIESDIRSEFRNMLYEAGWGPTLIESMEKGLISSWLHMDVQRRVGFGVMPWSQQVRALINMAGIPTGARAEEFLGAPGSVFVDAARGLTEQGIRENNWGKAFQQMSPTFIRNILKAAEYSPYGNGFASTGYGQVLTHDVASYELFLQAIGFTPTAIADQREALFQERKLDKGMNLFRQRKNAQITNAYRNIIMGGMKYNAALINKGQQQLTNIFADVMEYNADQPPHLLFLPDIRSLREEAMKAVYPGYRIATENKKLIGEKMKIRMALGLD